MIGIAILLTLSIGAVKLVNAQVVAIHPTTATIPAVGQTVTVDINITGVTNLYAYEIKVYFLNSIMNCTDSVRPGGHFLEPVNPGSEFIPKWTIDNAFNATHGEVWMSYTLLSPETGRTGGGSLVTLTFNGTAVGTSPIVLNNYPGVQGPVKLADGVGDPISHTTADGSIDVVPEFSAVMILSLFLLASLAVAAFTKLVKPRKV
jgi:hypothetical protein